MTAPRLTDVDTFDEAVEVARSGSGLRFGSCVETVLAVLDTRRGRVSGGRRMSVLTHRVDAATTRWGPTVLRWTAALLWLANVNWKVPPDFGRSGERCTALCRYVEAGADFPVVPGSAWFFDTIAAPNLAAFGWITLISESILVVLLVSGRFVRSAAVLGMAMSAGIGLAVANAEHEWYWSYLLMIALHVAILVTASTARTQPARTMAAITAALRACSSPPLTQERDSPAAATRTCSARTTTCPAMGPGHLPGFDRHRPGLRRDRPRRIVRRRPTGPPGSSHRWLDARRHLGPSAGLQQGGLIVGLGSRPGNACMLAALGLAIAVSPEGVFSHDDRAGLHNSRRRLP